MDDQSEVSDESGDVGQDLYHIFSGPALNNIEGRLLRSTACS